MAQKCPLFVNIYAIKMTTQRGKVVKQTKNHNVFPKLAGKVDDTQRVCAFFKKI